jgi:transcriptional regulator with XRE-family HTH domain
MEAKRCQPDKVWFDMQFGALNLSKREVARRFDMDAAVLNRMLSGQQRMTIRVLGLLAGLFRPLGISHAEIAARAGYPELLLS